MTCLVASLGAMPQMDRASSGVNSVRTGILASGDFEGMDRRTVSFGAEVALGRQS